VNRGVKKAIKYILVGAGFVALVYFLPIPMLILFFAGFGMSRAIAILTSAFSGSISLGMVSVLGWHLRSTS
jgi:hypothetical protein